MLISPWLIHENLLAPNALDCAVVWLIDKANFSKKLRVCKCYIPIGKTNADMKFAFGFWVSTSYLVVSEFRCLWTLFNSFHLEHQGSRFDVPLNTIPNTAIPLFSRYRPVDPIVLLSFAVAKYWRSNHTQDRWQSSTFDLTLGFKSWESD